MNHIWLRHFGQPIVPTVYDFGAGGREPTHPALLDWLAAEFMARGWSMKAMHRLICTSSAYRMASTDDPAQSSHDPDNLFLWRMPARRLVERGVRFVQLFHGYTGSAGAWDSHSNLKTNHTRLCKQIDQPIAGLIKHLKQRGMLDETMVVLGSEFGRTPGVDLLKRKVGTGRDHHPHGFTVMMAGGGVQRGLAYGATDPLGFHATQKRHYVTDLHQLGLDSHRLNRPGRIRLDRDYGNVMRGILA